MSGQRPPVAPLSRWVIAAAAIVVVIVMAEFSLALAKRQPQLGLTIERQDEHLVVTRVRTNSPASEAGVRPGDTVAATSGRPVTRTDDPTEVSTAAALQFRSGNGALFVASVTDGYPVSEQRKLPFLLIAMALVVVGGAVYVLADDLTAGSVVLAFGTVGAVAFAMGIATPSWEIWALGIEYVAMTLSCGATLLLFLVFPINYVVAPTGRRVAYLAAFVHAALIVLYGFAVAYSPTSYGLVQRLTFVVVLVDFLGAGVLAVLSWRRAQPNQRQVRRALGVVALGTVAGVAPFSLLSLGPYVLGHGYLIPPDIAIVSMVLLPVSLGAAVLSRQFLGISRLVRRGLVAVVVWTVLLECYTWGLHLLGQHVIGIQEESSPSLGSETLGIAIVAGTFPVVQRLLRSRVERALFQDVYDYAETLRQVSAEVTSLSGIDAISLHFLTRLGDTLDLRWAVVALEAGESSKHLLSWGDVPPGVTAGALLSHAASTRRGRKVILTDDLGAHLVPLIAEGAAAAVLAVGPKERDVELLPEDAALIATLAPMVGTALRNALLVRDLETQVAALGDRERALAILSAQLMNAQEEERSRIALDLHDDPLQRAILLAREIEDVPQTSRGRRLRQDVEEIIVSLRAICIGLRPRVLDDLGLAVGLEWLVNDLRARSDVTVGLAIEAANGSAAKRLPPDLELALYRVSQEALNNCLKHAQATQIMVTFAHEGEKITLSVVDNGLGWEEGRSGDRPAFELGILGMRERLRPWGGLVTVTPGPDEGTMVIAQVALGGQHA